MRLAPASFRPAALGGKAVAVVGAIVSRIAADKPAIAVAETIFTGLRATVSDAFLATRLSGPWRSTYGTGARNIDARRLVDRAAPS